MKKIFNMFPQTAGFTLIELLVVVAILGILAVTASISVQGAIKKSRISKRKADLRAIESALELYHIDHGSYPNPGWGWRSECNAWGGRSPSDVIPGLSPKYLKSFPSDPHMNKSGNTACYLYLSNGANYKLLDHNMTDLNRSDYMKGESLIDPARDRGRNGCKVDGSNPYAWSVYSEGGACW